MSSIAVRVHELQDATTFKEIFDVYIKALTNKSQDGDGYYLYEYEREVAKDSLDNLATLLDNSPMTVEAWGRINRIKHGAEEND